VVLILCTVVAGGVGCMSNVTYWALCTRFEGTHCTKAMSVGMTVGGLISVLAASPAAQNAGGTARCCYEGCAVSKHSQQTPGCPARISNASSCALATASSDGPCECWCSSPRFTVQTFMLAMAAVQAVFMVGFAVMMRRPRELPLACSLAAAAASACR